MKGRLKNSAGDFFRRPLALGCRLQLAETQIGGFIIIIVIGTGKNVGKLLPIRIAALFRLLRVGFARLLIWRLGAHRIPQRRHMLARPAIRTIAASVLNVQITIHLQPYRIVFRTAHLRPITPGGSFLDIANLALLKIQQTAFDDIGRK